MTDSSPNGLSIPANHPVAAAIVNAIREGDVDSVQAQLRSRPALAAARVVDRRGVSRSLLHVAADWPGHFPNAAQIVALLATSGANVNSRVAHPDPTSPPETPLHWAASSDDVAVIDALLDAGADIEAPGAVFTGGTPMSDAVVFARWAAARRLLERGAATTLWQSAALGLLDRVRDQCATEPPPTAHELTNALWHACRGGQRSAAEHLLQLGADPSWVGYDNKTAYQAADESGNTELAEWLRAGSAVSFRAEAGQ